MIRNNGYLCNHYGNTLQIFIHGFAAIYEIHNFFSEKIELKQKIFKYFTNVFLSLYHEIHVTNHLKTVY